MKHLKQLTKTTPKHAALWQDMMGHIVSTLNDIIGAFNGESPMLGYLADKFSYETGEE